MPQWIVQTEEGQQRYNGFEEAVAAFRQIIREYIEGNDEIFGRDSTPFQVGAFFGYKYDEGIISDEEIVVSTRLDNLLNSFRFNNQEEAERLAVTMMPRDIDYEGEIEEFGEKLTIRVTHHNREIEAVVIHDDGQNQTYLETNAFIFDNLGMVYSFKSHQIISTTWKEGNLGKVVDLFVRILPDIPE